MKRTIPVILAALLALISTVSLSACDPKNETAHPAPTSAMKQKTLWTCAMHPQVRKEAPGRCPICGMTLVKLDQNQGDHETPVNAAPLPDSHASFSLSGSRQQMIGVKTGFAVKKPLFKDIEAAGRLAFDPELYTAQNEYAEALLQMERVKNSPLPDVKHSARRMVQSAKLRLKILGLSDKQIAQIGAGQGAESNLLITKPGSQVWIYADIFEMDLPYVRPGQSAEITAEFLGGRRLAGKVVSVDRVINPASRTAKARILVSESGTYLRPESYVDVTIHSPMGDQVTVPFDAVLDTGKQSWVFVVSDDGTFAPRLVQIKFHAGDDVAIGSGLSGGEKIVTSGNFLIDSESRLKAVGMAAKPTVPSCPKGQHWDVSMAMCMPDIGGGTE